MSRRSICFFIILLSSMLAVCSAAEKRQEAPAEKGIPFRIGERLTYSLKWSVIPVGVAVFEVLDGHTTLGRPSYLFRLSVKSYPLIDLIYKVRDHIESYVDRSVTHSLFYKKKQREGRHKRDVEVRFDWDQSKAHYYSTGTYEKTVDIIPGTFDPLGIFYAFRLTPLKDDLEVETPVTDGKKSVIGRAKVIKREKVKIDSREFDTYLIEPDLQHIGGVFEKSKDAKLHVWVTADDRRIVVKTRSKVVVGYFTGELVSAEGVAK